MKRVGRVKSLYEVFESDSESELTDSEEQKKYSVFICKEIESQPKCFLCGNIVKLCFDLSEQLEGNNYTFSDILIHLCSKETLPSKIAKRNFKDFFSNIRDIELPEVDIR